MTQGENIFQAYLFVQAKASTLCPDVHEQRGEEQLQRLNVCLQRLVACLQRLVVRMQRVVARLQ